jgi:pantetheine-phosphate adenylyltransferase
LADLFEKTSSSRTDRKFSWMARTAFFPGSFDPLTKGHVDVMRGALGLADRLVVAIGVNPGKKPLFSTEARVEMISEVVATLTDEPERVTVVSYEGLLVDAARKAGADLIVRGIRDAGDITAELRMAAMNQDMSPSLQTVFLPATPKHRHISATLVRQVAEMRGDVSAFVPPPVAARLAELR